MNSGKSYIIEIPQGGLDGGGADMRGWLQAWEWRTSLPEWADSVTLDFRKNQFIEPWALAMYAAYALSLGKQMQKPVVAALDPQNPANLYVARMGLEQVLASGLSTEDWDESRQNTGLHVIRTHQDVTRFARSAAQLGSGPDDETMDALRYGMIELGRNVVQHSQSSIGGVAIAQYFPDRGALQIAISDCGCGVFAALRSSYTEIRSDMESLKVAVLPHSSGARTNGPYSAADNVGLGLFFVKEICWRADGSFWLASGRALLGVQGYDAAGKGRVYRDINPWVGTTVTMDIPAEGVGDLSALLHTCRTLATESRASSGPSALDFLTEMPEVSDVQRIEVRAFVEDVEKAASVRHSDIIPAMNSGRNVVLDFAEVRFATQSFVHALLYDALRMPGALFRLSFLNCTPSTEEAIRVVAAYAASYRQIV